MRGAPPILAVACAVLAGGCNAIFGLDPVASTGDGDAATDAATLDADRDAAPIDADGDAPGPPIDAPLLDGPTIDAAPPTCATFPGGLPDEDADGRRDVCDNCPYLYNAPMFPDADTDGIGDLCDPRSGQPDRLVAFYNFAGSAVPPEFQLLALGGTGTGTWSVTGGRLQLRNAELGTHYLARLNVGLRDVTVVTQATVLTPLAPPTPGTSRSVGEWVDIDPATPGAFPNGVVIETAETTSTGGLTSHFAHLVGVGGATSENVSTPPNTNWFVPGMVYRMHITCRSTPTSSCDGFATYPGLGHSLSLPSATTRVGAVGLRVYAVDAAFDYFAIYAPSP